VRILTETVAAETLGDVRANAVMPSVIDTPMNREMMPDAASVTSGAAVPVYGEV